MRTFLEIVGGGALVIGGILLLMILGTLVGAIVGWVVGLFFTGPILDFLSRVGVNTTGLSMWNLGAALGFIGGFFKATVTQTKS